MKEIIKEKQIRPQNCLLALDIDGTLTNTKKEVTLAVQEALRLFSKAGGQIILASGRPTYGIVPVAEILHLPENGGYILAYNGGRVMDCKSGEYLYEKNLPSDVISILAEQAKQYKVNIMTYEDDCIITEQPDDVYCVKESQINHMKIKKVDSFADYVDFPVTKCLLTADGEYLQTVEEKMKAYWGDRLSICRSEPFFLEVTANGIDKAGTLSKVLELLRLDRENLVACGDGFNDISMISYAGLGVAMANGNEKTKEAADCIAPSNDEDGVAAVVRCLLDCAG